jgi:phospholipase C
MPNLPLSAAATAMVAIMSAAGGIARADSIAPTTAAAPGPQNSAPTATPIKHLVVLFNENVSFDHYFATYPKAANPPGEPAFTASAGTPAMIDTLANANLLRNNPNFTNKSNGGDAAEPFRLDRTQAFTADQNHAYTAEQQATDGGKMDLFPKYTGKGTNGGAGAFGIKGQVMGYYDGNTVMAMWMYAQHFAMSDNAWTDTYGPSTPGMLNISSGETNGMTIVVTTKKPSTLASVSYYVNDGQGSFTMINDVDPGYDVCSNPKDQAMMEGETIGDLLNKASVTWGSFMGGFRLDATNPNGSTNCKRSTHSTVVGADVVDYIPHHAWFQYYPPPIPSMSGQARSRPSATASSTTAPPATAPITTMTCRISMTR